jgi:hypothetical protein
LSEIWPLLPEGHFADRLCAAIERLGSPVVVGLDPRLEFLPEPLLAACRREFGATPRAAGEALWRFNRAIIDAVHDVVPVVKPQVAFYERYGLDGMRAFAQTVGYARERGLLVIADAKRNDIGSTAEAYADAFLGMPTIFGQAVLPSRSGGMAGGSLCWSKPRMRLPENCRISRSMAGHSMSIWAHWSRRGEMTIVALVAIRPSARW